MDSQIEICRSLDALLVLGGEKEDHSRSNHAYHLYNNTDSSLHLVLSGWRSGFSDFIPEESEAETMHQYLLQQGVPDEVMHIEDQSLDTLGNMVFSRPIIDQILADSSKKRIGIVTDKFHLDRGMYAAKLVFPKNYEIHPLANDLKSTFFDYLKEIAIKNAWRFDFWHENIQPGEQENFEKYLSEKHPMHSANSPLSAYKLGFCLLKYLKRERLIAT